MSHWWSDLEPDMLVVYFTFLDEEVNKKNRTIKITGVDRNLLKRVAGKGPKLGGKEPSHQVKIDKIDKTTTFNLSDVWKMLEVIERTSIPTP